MSSFFDPGGALLRGFQIAQQIQGQRLAQQRQQTIEGREKRIAEQQQQDSERRSRLDDEARELQNLETRLRIRREGGRRLTKAERAKLDGGGDFSVQLGDGIASTASAGDIVGIGQDEFLLPNAQHVGRASAAAQIDQDTAAAEIGKVPIPEALAQLTGLAPGTLVRPQDIDDYAREFGPKERKLERLTDARTGNVQYVDPRTGEVVSLFEGAARPAPSQAQGRLSAKDAKAEKIEAAASSLVQDADLDVERAERLLRQRAKKDKFLAENLTNILGKLRALRQSRPKTSGVDPALQRSLGGGAQPSDPFEGLSGGDLKKALGF